MNLLNVLGDIAEARELARLAGAHEAARALDKADAKLRDAIRAQKSTSAEIIGSTCVVCSTDRARCRCEWASL